MKYIIVFAILFFASPTLSIDNGLGRTPPMGWRSWNCYHHDINQEKMEATMDAMALKRGEGSKAMSLLDLGYTNCGLDDNWQACGEGVDSSFHSEDGSPLINTQSFPDMKKMTDHGHSLGLRVGWYMNNCICAEKNFKGAMITKIMQRSAAAVASYGFDGVKLDGCSQFRNLTWWASLLNATGRPILIENCHWGQTVPGDKGGDGPCTGTTTPSDCPYNFFRTSGDIQSNWGSVMKNLMSTTKYQNDPPLARPGSWAYPDMLEVGQLANHDEDRSHFSAWAITSSPLILGFDLTNNDTFNRVWDIISNEEVIAVNQAWAGHPGRLSRNWNPDSPGPSPSPGLFTWGIDQCSINTPGSVGWKYNNVTKAIEAPSTNETSMCLDVDKSLFKSLLAIKPCSGEISQQWIYDESDKTIKSADGKCVDVYDFIGPVVQIYRCNDGKNQQFSFTADGQLFDMSGQCLVAKEGAPSQAGNSGAKKMMIWTKPVGSGKIAALIINNDVTNHTVAIDIKLDLGIASGKANVRCLYCHKDLGLSIGTFNSGAIDSHDSRMLMFTAQ